MSAELSYAQLKVANDARASEELKLEQRRRDLLVLILHYLQDEGFLDTARVFCVEAGPSLSKYEVCDNIDLTTILQEYEAYYFVKFKKNPKITKKIPSSADGCKRGKQKPLCGRRIGQTSTSTSKNSVVSLPDLSTDSRGGMVWGTTGGQDGSVAVAVRGKKDKVKDSLVSTESSKELGLTGYAIKEEKHPHQKDKHGGVSDGGGGRGKKDARLVTDIRPLFHDPTSDLSNESRLLKPIAGFTGYSMEMRELAAVISRDIYLHDPEVHWNHIIGLDHAKRLVKEAVMYPIKYPQLFTGILSPWKGLLLYGPPGTGKTMLAKAVATECKTTFFNISASSIVSKWRGDSEKLIRVLFELARFHAPSTIFVDELESIMGQRAGFGAQGGEHEGSRRMKTELLVQMDGLAKSSDLVFLLAASNIPWELDHAMLRRLEKRILVDLPTQQARSAMFRYHLPAIVSKPPVLITSQIDYDVVAGLTEGYSGSDIKLVCKEAAMQPVRQVFDKLESMTEERASLESVVIDPILTADVKTAISRTKPSAKLLTQRYLHWQNDYESL